MKREVAQRLLASRWFAAMLFAALLGRALIPVGFMPAQGGIVLCSGYAPVPSMQASAVAQTMPGMDMPGMDMSGDPSQRHGIEFCPYTAVASVMAAGQASPVAAFTHFVVTTVVFPAEKSVPRGTIVPTSLPRGPPTTV